MSRRCSKRCYQTKCVPARSRRPPRLMEALRHAALGGGKRLRPFLTVETARLLGQRHRRALRAGCAVELLHCYSLVHDDLPSMDDDDLRRGRPTVHKAFDDATAILAGDALQTLAFEVLADPATDPDPAIRAELVLRLARASGVGGMVGGQMLDLAAEGRYGEAHGRSGRRSAPAGHENRGDPAFSVEAGAVIARAERCRSRGPRGLREGPRRGVPDRRRHSRPGSVVGSHGKAHRQGSAKGQGHAGGPPRDGRKPVANARAWWSRRMRPWRRSATPAEILRQAVRFVVEREV